MGRRVVIGFTVACLGAAACGRDPILEQARKNEAAQQTAASRKTEAPAGAVATNSAGGGSATGGSSGPDAANNPGVPEEPKPGDPSIPPPAGGATPTAPATAGTPGGVVTPAPPGSPGALAPGIPEEPAPGDPNTPPPPGGATPLQPLPGSGGLVVRGPSVDVSGLVAYEGWRTGKVKITAFDGDHSAASNKHPKVVGIAEIDRPGAFSMKVPASVGQIYVEASVDEDDDGRPGPLDPQGQADRFPVTVGTDPIDDLTITLQRREPPPGKKK
jgi:hypothetical protein